MILALRKLIVKVRMKWADIRGHHGKVWDYEPGDYYMGRQKGHIEHEKLHEEIKRKRKQRQAD
tara:strand:+ start:997 stop:1185 length:189 start_codon:yes stop_codon:yes gene_type:complete